ncbi:MAG: LysR family transcriptional regulator [Solirubrobacteraceae bacterium]|nr:LysR family transcriptional regulator [Solirubrobacteraceae bacterium]
MKLRQLRYFAVLAEELHFTRAAARLHLAQPALSQQLRRLEDEVGLRLVDRTTHRVALTDAGRTLLARARTVLAEIDAAEAELAALAGRRTGRLTIGVTPTPGPLDLPSLLARFHAAHPGIALDLREALSVDLATALRDDAIDVAFVADLPEAHRKGLRLDPVARQPLVAVVPPGHRLARRRRLGLADVAAEPLVAFRRGATIRTQLEARAAEDGLTLRVAFEAGDGPRARALVAAGLGVAVLPEGDATIPGPDVVVVPLRDRTLAHGIHLAVRRGRHPSPAVEGLRALVEEREPRVGTPDAS